NRLAEALDVLLRGRTAAGGDWSGLLAEIGYTHARLGDGERAEAILEELRAREANEFIDPYTYAMIHVALGNYDEVFEALHAACEARSIFLPSFPVDPKFFPLRDDPRYNEILTRLNLPAP
ncbi:MAG TPA: hypothetical protein VMS21_05350, partial [Methylomirabilota bacterium]|nr:hypothetical protein [Methylomirabilota bacterium]